MTYKEKIKNNFSRYAHLYDDYAGVQDLCALALIDKLTAGKFNRILDIGCGTGNYTKLLREKFPAARIKATDISETMIDIAKKKLNKKNVEFIIADAENPCFNDTFDLISSNASLQWIGDLEARLLAYKNLLNSGGMISFSTFGPDTFRELRASLKELFGKSIKISSSHFMEEGKIRGVLCNLFKKVILEKKVYKERYNSLEGLLKKIKYSGIRGAGTSARNIWSPKALADLEKIYKKKFKKILATYEVFFCKGEK